MPSPPPVPCAARLAPQEAAHVAEEGGPSRGRLRRTTPGWHVAHTLITWARKGDRCGYRVEECFFGWRDVVVSYERFLDVVYTDLMAVYGPRRLRVSLRTNVKGRNIVGDHGGTVTGRLEEGRTSSGTGSRGLRHLHGWPGARHIGPSTSDRRGGGDYD